MNLLLLLPYAIQLLLIVHIVKTKSDGYWIYIVLFLPYVGGLAYLAAVVLPGLFRGRRSNASMIDIVARTVAPSLKIREYKATADLSPTVENRKRLADEYLAAGELAKAEEIYASLLSGLYKDDSALLLARARALYGLGRWQDADALVAALDAKRYEYRNEAELLVKLKVRERVAPRAEVDALYEAARARYDSFEIVYYYADYLARSGDLAKARAEIAAAEGLKAQLDRNRVIYDRKWVRELRSLSRRIG